MTNIAYTMMTREMAIACLGGHKIVTRRLWSPLWQSRARHVADGGRLLLYIREPIVCRKGLVKYQAYGAAAKVAGKTVPWKTKAIKQSGRGCRRSWSRMIMDVSSITRTRLHSMSETDAMAEGVQCINLGSYGIETDLRICGGITHPQFDHAYLAGMPKQSFKKLWQKIHRDGAPGCWANNPEVAVIHFKIIQQNIDEFVDENK